MENSLKGTMSANSMFHSLMLSLHLSPLLPSSVSVTQCQHDAASFPHSTPFLASLRPTLFFPHKLCRVSSWLPIKDVSSSPCSSFIPWLPSVHLCHSLTVQGLFLSVLFFCSKAVTALLYILAQRNTCSFFRFSLLLAGNSIYREDEVCTESEREEMRMKWQEEKRGW